MRFGLPADAPAVAPRWNLEVQIHPGDIRKRVRYLFLSRRQLTAVSVVALLYIAGVALAAALAPGVIASLANPLEVRGLLAERRLQGERLQALTGRVDELDRHAQELDLRMAKVSLAYGLPPLTRPQRAGAPAAESDPRSIYAEALEEAHRSQLRLRQRLQGLDGSLGAVRAFEGAHPDQVRVTPSTCPLEGEFVLVGSFGKRRSPFTRELEFHPGVDLSAPVGTPIHATADGVVVFAGQVPIQRSREWWRYGNVVIVENGDGFFTIFGHDDRVEVRPGQRVKRGDLLATVGNTGWGVTSPHVHYEVRRRDADGTYRPVDPLIYILDHRWPNEDRLLLAARTAPPVRDFEPLPVGPTKASRKAGAS
ncbi:MAG TPA: M23 family metallopeptidase [Thermoanaerobaculia bacterium]|jgi:murein DD-endopeptidase MepM/ murein hydrolase activator NlpD|nr:M23 family metallopeptidase [Thermoanaerobaculia bacterium]